MTETTGIGVEDRDGVRWITLARPERRNAVDPAMARALNQAIDDVRDDLGCRVIVIRGEGSSFCAGWDIHSISELRGESEERIRAEFAANRRLLDDLRDAPQVTLVAVHGAVLGFGIGLVAACDLSIAARGARIGLPEIGLGVVPGIVMLDLIRRVPLTVALDWLLTGESRSAEDALAAGLVGRVVPDGELSERVASTAATLAGHDPAILRETKRLFRAVVAAHPAQAADVAIEGAIGALLRG